MAYQRLHLRILCAQMLKHAKQIMKHALAYKTQQLQRWHFIVFASHFIEISTCLTCAYVFGANSF